MKEELQSKEAEIVGLKDELTRCQEQLYDCGKKTQVRNCFHPCMAASIILLSAVSIASVDSGISHGDLKG